VWETLVDALSESVGTQNAQELVESAATDAGIPPTGSYSREDALAVVETITERDDVSVFVRIAGNTLKARIQTGNV